jgi:hypothetical protein
MAVDSADPCGLKLKEISRASLSLLFLQTDRCCLADINPLKALGVQGILRPASVRRCDSSGVKCDSQL